MSSTIHITNDQGRDATVGIVSIKPPSQPTLGLLGKKLIFKRYISATEDCTHESLKKKYGDDYAQELINSDPEIDIEKIGMFIDQTQTVYLDSSGELMYVEPNFIEIILNPEGSEKERRDPINTVMNVNDEIPVKYSGRFIPINEAVVKFGFRRRLQLRHSDGLTFDFLYNIAKELESKKSLMLIGTGEKGIGSLVFQSNGRQYRGFLQGKTRDRSYQLILHLSEMELKKPQTIKGKAKDE
jgi:hypothetical protein